MTGFFDAIAEGCSSDRLSFGGGYNSTSQELALNIVLNLGGSRNLEQALKSLAHLVDLPLEESFFEQLRCYMYCRPANEKLYYFSAAGGNQSSQHLQGSHYIRPYMGEFAHNTSSWFRVCCIYAVGGSSLLHRTCDDMDY